MIVRILGEAQFELDDDNVEELEEHDKAMLDAMNAGDEKAFHAALKAVLSAVHANGKPVPADTIAPSDLVVPSSDATLEEVRSLLASEDSGVSPEDSGD
jgi:hypothetical protein